MTISVMRFPIQVILAKCVTKGRVSVIKMAVDIFSSQSETDKLKMAPKNKMATTGCMMDIITFIWKHYIPNNYILIKVFSLIYKIWFY